MTGPIIALTRLLPWLIIWISWTACATATLQPQIPSVRSFSPGVYAKPFMITPATRIVVDSKSANQGSPSLYQFAQVFRADLIEITGLRNLQQVSTAPTAPHSSIFLTTGTVANLTLFNGKYTREAYEFDVTDSAVRITGAQPIGAWWGTRTLLQQVVGGQSVSTSVASKSFSVPSGRGSDAPGWEVRGFMLDAGRHWFDTKFLSDLCAYASFFKINEFHIHASDNLWDPAFLYGADWRLLYTGFRFQPPVDSSIAGLVPHRNESWTHSQFFEMQNHCAVHGVTLVPEIDTPGHSLVISQWKPELALPGTPDNLNLSFPDTIPTIQSIWDEFTPWFTSGEVSIGADEYEASLANDYISFVNEMSDFFAVKGKSIRIWGTNEPSQTLSISKNVTIQHWDFPGDDIPVNLLSAGYHVINSEQAFLYLEGKIAAEAGFPQELNEDLMWSGAPGGVGWSPNIFSGADPMNNTRVNEPHLRGSIMPLWNDWGSNSSTQLEIYYQLAKSLALFAEKTWAGSGTSDTALTRDAFDLAYPSLNAAAPGQNLNRVVQANAGGIVYSFSHVLDSPFPTGVDSVGPPYTLTFSVRPESSNATGALFAGSDSTLYAQTLTFESNGQFYSLDYTLPPGHYTTVAIHATREYTYAVVGGVLYWWTTLLDIWGDGMLSANMSFAAPSSVIGSVKFKGDIKDVTLALGA